MGNRFFALTGYQGLIRAHGVMAALTFLLLVPAAILIMRFYGKNPRRAVRFHIWLQTTTLLLVTAVVITGFFAVGPRRALTNPHHGIGVAIYVLIWLQILGGIFVHRSERGKRRLHVPLKAMFHHWLGRAIALLGIAQVALGLTLYGSPLYLFVLYTLWVFALLVAYFVLQFLHERRRAQIMPGGQSEYSEEVITEARPEKSHSGFGKLAAAGAAGVGLAALFNRRSKPKRRYSESDVTQSYVSSSSASSAYGEKPTPQRQNRPGIGKRILEVGAIGGGLAAAKSLFSRRKAGRDDESEIDAYRPPLGGNTSIMSDSVSRLEEGRTNRPVTPTAGMAAGAIRPSTHPLAQPPMTPGSALSEEYSYYDYESSSPSRRGGRHQTFKEAVAAGGAVFAVRQLFKGRKEKKDAEHAERLRRERIDQERLARANSQHRYTGDGLIPPRRVRNNRVESQTASDVSSAMPGSVQQPSQSRLHDYNSTMSPVMAGGASAAAASALADRNRIRPVGNDPVIAPPMPASAMATEFPPPPPPHGVDPMSSGSELYTTASGRQRHRHHLAEDAALLGGGAAMGAAAMNRRRTEPQNTDSMESPPVSIHVKTQDNGRKVTLRRLTEEEAAAQRAARRTERRTSNRRRNSSFSDSSAGEILGNTAAEQRWRRTEQREEEQQAAMDARTPTQSHVAPSMYPTPPPPGTQQAIDPHTGASYSMPAVPPIPASTSNLGPAGSITSPGTETSGPSEYANNRRRRRAERAQARIARGAGQNTVDFT